MEGEGDPAHVIIDVASEKHADLIAVGAGGSTGVRRFVLGVGEAERAATGRRAQASRSPKRTVRS